MNDSSAFQRECRQRYDNFEVVRIVCMVLLVFHHYQGLSQAVFGYINFHNTNGRWQFGYLTEVFYVISGFLVAAKSFEPHFIKYYKYKILRVIPFALLSNILYLFVAIIYHLVNSGFLFDEKYSGAQIICAMLFIDRGWIIDFSPAFNGPIWYIDILFLCYILFYLFKKIEYKFGMNPVILPLFFSAMSVILNYIDVQIPFFWSCNRRGYISFFMGVAVREVMRKIKPRKLQILACGGVFLYGLMLLILNEFNYYGLVVLLYPSLILLLANIKQIDCRFISKLGSAQFEVYLWNVPIYAVGVLLSEVTGLYIQHSYLSMILFAVTVEIVGFLVYQYFERPLLRLIRSFLL